MLNKKRKVVSIALSVFMLFSMTACNKTPQDNQSEGTSLDTVQTSAPDESSEQLDYDDSTIEGWGAAVRESHNGETITVAMAAHPSTDAFQSMADDFTKLTGISIMWDVVEETNLKSKQLLDSQGNGSYDVMMVDAFWMSEYASKNVLTPIDSYTANAPDWFDYEDIMPAYRNGIAGAGGVNYGIPSSGETRFIAYRTDLFEEHGKQPPATMDEFLELAQYFNTVEGIYGVSMRAQRGIHFASGWMSLMYNFGAGFVDQSSLGTEQVIITANDDETVASLRFYVDLLACAPPDVGTYTHEEALNAFTSGKTAMWLDATALAGNITDPSASVVADKVAFVPTPTGPAGDGAALAGWSLGISETSSNKDAAWAFICYMTGRGTSVEYIMAGGGATRSSIFENDMLSDRNPSYPAQQEALISANGLVEKGLSWIPQHDRINQILEIAGAYGSAALAGDITVEDACSSAQDDIEDLLGSS